MKLTLHMDHQLRQLLLEENLEDMRQYPEEKIKIIGREKPQWSKEIGVIMDDFGKSYTVYLSKASPELEDTDPRVTPILVLGDRIVPFFFTKTELQAIRDSYTLYFDMNEMWDIFFEKISEPETFERFANYACENATSDPEKQKELRKKADDILADMKKVA